MRSRNADFRGVMMTGKRHPAVQEIVRRRTEGDVGGAMVSAPSAMATYTAALSEADRRAFKLYDQIVSHFSKQPVEWTVEPPTWLAARRGNGSTSLRIRELWRKPKTPEEVVLARSTSGLLRTGRLQVESGSWRISDDQRGALEDFLTAIIHHIEDSLDRSQSVHDEEIRYQSEKARRSAEHAARLEVQRREETIWQQFLEAVEMHDRLKRAGEFLDVQKQPEDARAHERWEWLRRRVDEADPLRNGIEAFIKSIDP